jgi:DNA-binding MarR family transcriptional regulator
VTGQQSGGDQFSARSLAVWRGLLRVHAHVVAAQNADLEDKLGLSVTEWEVLHALATAPDGQRRVRDVAGIVLLTSGGVTRLVNRLEQRGLVARVACPDDKRGTSIAITDTGRGTYQQARPADVLQELFLNRLTDAQQQQLIAAWEAVLPGASSLDDLTWSRRHGS